MIKVSVIIPMYNVEKYIGQCVESVCGQTLRELEVICIDDGSNDATAQVVESLREKDERVSFSSPEESRGFRVQKCRVKTCQRRIYFFSGQ